MIQGSNFDWKQFAKQCSPSWHPKRKKADKAVKRILEIARRKAQASSSPPKASEAAAKFLFRNSTDTKMQSFEALSEKAVCAAIVSSAGVLLKSPGKEYYVPLLNASALREWLVEVIGKTVYGENASADEINRITEALSQSFCSDLIHNLRCNYVMRRKEKLLTSGNNMFPLQDKVSVVSDGKIKTMSYAECGAAFRYQLDAKFDLEAEGFYTRRFLRDFLGADEEEDKAAWLRFWETLGYLLVPNQSAKVILFWYGLGDDGKSTLIRVVKKMVFPEGAVNDADIKTTTGSFGLSACIGSMLVVFHETNKPISLETSNFWKRITGGDGVTVNRKHRDMVQGKLNAKMLVTANKFVTFAPGVLDRALERRLEFVQVYAPKHEKDPELGEKLYAERDFIITQAIRGYARLQKNNFRFTACKKDSRLKELVLNGDATRAFLEDCADPACVQGPIAGDCTFASELAEVFKRWKKITGEKLTYKNLRESLLMRGFQYGRIRTREEDEFEGFGSQPRVWRGLKLKK